MAAHDTERLTNIEINEASRAAEDYSKPEDIDSDSADPTGLDDLEDLALRLEESETFSGTSDASEADEQNLPVAEHAYDFLLAVIDEEGHTVVNGIIVLRATDKVFDAWNSLLKEGNFDKDAYQKAALGAVSGAKSFDQTSIYHLTGQAFTDMIDFVGCSILGLSEIKLGVEAMRRRIKDALEFERKENSKANQIRAITRKLIDIERDERMQETTEGVDLSVVTDSSQNAAMARRKHTGRQALEWIDEHRLEILKIYRDNPDLSHRARANIFNSRFPGASRSKNGTRQEHARLVSKGITIAQLEAKLDGES